jgi:hypothetical protein
MSFPIKTSTIAVGLVALLVGGGLAAAAVTITQANPNKIAPGEGQVQGSTDMTIDSQSLSYSGVNATGVTVDVNNAGTTDHTGDVHISVKKADGTIVDSTTKSGQNFAGNGTVTSVSYTFSSELPIDSFSKLEVVVEQTA